MNPRNIIVIGASAGGFEAIKGLIGALPADLQAALLIVWHMGAGNLGVLPTVLNASGPLKAENAVDGELIIVNRIYLAPPDQHMLIENGHIRLTRGPKENRFRPAIDPLFRSASFTYGPRVIGIILSGALDDGVAGLWTIKKYGGIAVVQDPGEAEFPSMPDNALEVVDVDYKLKVGEMAALLTELTKELVKEDTGLVMADEKRVQVEVRVAMDEPVLEREVMSLGKLSPYTCPECNGVLSSVDEGNRQRYRCHTGHAFSADTLLKSLTEKIESSLWSAVRGMQESVMLLNSLGDHYSSANEPKLAGLYFKKAKQARNREFIVRQAIKEHEQLDNHDIAVKAGAR